MAGGNFGGGNGNPETPYLVEDAADLNAVRNGLGKAYLQTQDITLSGEWTPIGSPSSPFTGMYDGGGYNINGLSITGSTVSGGNQHFGLFGYMNGSISNIVLGNGSINFTFTQDGRSVAAYVGSIAGQVIANAEINGCVNESCTITVNCEIENSSYNSNGYVGGLFGIYSNGGNKIVNCHNKANINFNRNYNMNGPYHIGAILAYNNGYNPGNMYNCSNSGNITADIHPHPESAYEYGYDNYLFSYYNGLAGSTYNTNYTIWTYNCFNSGKVSGFNSIASLGRYPAEDCYNSGELIGGDVYGLTSSWTKRCFNTGTLRSNKRNGKVLGLCGSSANDCYNTGDLYSYGGYVCGVTENWCTNCYNSGDLYGFTGAYGITSSTNSSNKNLFALNDKIVRLAGSTVADKWYRIAPVCNNCFAIDTLVLEFE